MHRCTRLPALPTSSPAIYKSFNPASGSIRKRLHLRFDISFLRPRQRQ